MGIATVHQAFQHLVSESRQARRTGPDSRPVAAGWSGNSRRLACRLVLAGLLTAAIAPRLMAQAGADSPPHAERSFQTQIVQTPGQGKMVLIGGGLFSENDGRYVSEHPMVMEYGVTDRWQATFVLLPSMLRDPATGALVKTTGDWLVGTKRDFMDLGGSGVHLATGFNFATPSNPDGPTSSGARSYSPFLVLAKDLPGTSRLFTHLRLSLRQNVRESETDATHVLHWSTAYYVPVGRYLLTSEFTLSTDRWNHGGQTRQMYYTPGLFRKLGDHWWVGAGFPVGLNSDSTDFGVAASIVCAFKPFATLR